MAQKTIKVKILKQPGLQLPKSAHPGDAGFDIIATSDPIIKGVSHDLSLDFTAHATDRARRETLYSRIDHIEYKTNIFLSPGLENHVLIFPRSSVSKYNLVLANSIGLADGGYTGEYGIKFKYILQPEDLVVTLERGVLARLNTSKLYAKGDKIAQLVFRDTVLPEFEFVDELPTTDRGAGGFGSTDTKLPVTTIGTCFLCKAPVLSNQGSVVVTNLLNQKEIYHHPSCR